MCVVSSCSYVGVQRKRVNVAEIEMYCLKRKKSTRKYKVVAKACAEKIGI